MSEAYLLKEHREWIGLLQPVGLVVSPTALARAQLRLQKDVFELQNELMSITDDAGLLPMHLLNLFVRVLGWRKEDLFTGDSIDDLHVYLPERETLLKADFAVKNVDTQSFEILIKDIAEKNFDEDEVPEGRGWQATPHAKFERHLREKNISIGILVSRAGLRLVYAPKGETSGYLTFPFTFMRETQGRPVLSALHLLLSEDRLFKGDPIQRLPSLLVESRKFQNDVSTQLSEQVLAALYELLRGIQEADKDSSGKLLKAVLAHDKNNVYHGLLTVLLRIVFILYAEDRDLLSSDPVFLNNYSINGLFARLREDASKHLDSMNFRYGAWSHLLSLFGLIFNGLELDSENLPGRKGHLFDPSQFPFLEGKYSEIDKAVTPKISDGVVWRILSNLMSLDGERISYRALDVEQIGSVYETVMGFRLEIAEGPSIALKSPKPGGAPVFINLQSLLAESGDKRAARIRELTDQKVEGKLAESIRQAATADELVVAFGKRIAEWASPTIVNVGEMILQPSDERRRSGSHYTPRALTAPIVANTLEPVLRNMGPRPTPEQILDLKICDPAMGSGAFLVEACRQLSELLVKSWAMFTPDIRRLIPPDEDELLFARRMIAQRCLYGVDKNPMAVNLAKVSLWLATFAKQHDFMFLDHCLKCGDSLVGLPIEQIVSASWRRESSHGLQISSVRDKLLKVQEIRESIRTAGEETDTSKFLQLKAQEDEVLGDLRSVGDALISSFLNHSDDKTRKRDLTRVSLVLESWFASGIRFRDFKGLDDDIALLHRLSSPFYWHLEFSEVFERTNPGFDVFIGNPPFAGVVTLAKSTSSAYTDFLRYEFEDTGGKCDLIAFFFRRAWELVRAGGAVGFIATKTVAQGHTRKSGLSKIISAGGKVIWAIRSLEWPGIASVFIAIVVLYKGEWAEAILDGKRVTNINSYLLPIAGNTDPLKLRGNRDLAFLGLKPGAKWHILGKASDGNLDEKAVDSIINKYPAEASAVSPYVSGVDIYAGPECWPQRRILSLGNKTAEEIQRFPNLVSLARAAVESNGLSVDGEWWKFARPARELFNQLPKFSRVLVKAEVSDTFAFVFLPSNLIFSNKTVVILLESARAFGMLQSCFHEIWARFSSSTQGEGLSYVPGYSFETFPMPKFALASEIIGLKADEFYSARSKYLHEENIGLTELYNRLHDPAVQSYEIDSLRRLDLEMNQSVAAEYGWRDMNLAFDFHPSGVRSDGIAWGPSEQTREEILARLMDLNFKQHEAEGAEEIVT